MNSDKKGRPRLEGRVIRAAGGIALLAFLRERGIDGDALVAEVGLPQEAFAHPDNVVPLIALGRLFARSAELAGVPDIGLAVGSRMTFDALGLVGYMMANAETVGAGLESLRQFLHVNNNAVVPYLLREDGVAVLGYEPFASAYAGSDQLMFGALAIVTNGLRALCGRAFGLRGVSFAYGSPANPRTFRRFFAAPVTFNDTRSAVTFDAAWLDCPIADADPTLRELIERQVRAMGPPGDEPKATDEIQRVIRTMLLAGAVSEEEAARAFGMSRRTLARRLQDAGSSFQEQLDHARAEAARFLLQDGGTSIADVAARLGYASTASFARAFARWEGTTPGRWRRDAKAL